jgi:predicted Zn-dependent protease
VVDRVLPSFIDPKTVRVYVVVNPEWAIVLGHEITHAAYEHSRRQASKAQWTGLAEAVAGLGASQISNGTARQIASTAVGVGVGTFNNTYSREYEDQSQIENFFFGDHSTATPNQPPAAPSTTKK